MCRSRIPVTTLRPSVPSPGSGVSHRPTLLSKPGPTSFLPPQVSTLTPYLLSPYRSRPLRDVHFHPTPTSLSTPRSRPSSPFTHSASSHPTTPLKVRPRSSLDPLPAPPTRVSSPGVPFVPTPGRVAPRPRHRRCHPTREDVRCQSWGGRAERPCVWATDRDGHRDRRWARVPLRLTPQFRVVQHQP